MRRSAVCAVACLLAAAAANAAIVGGYVDVSYNLNLNNPPPAGLRPPPIPLRYYHSEDRTWILNMAHVAITGGLSREAEYVIEIDAGEDANWNSLASGMDTPYFDLQEAYVDVAVSGREIGLRLGKFATFAGIEVMEAPENYTLSRGLIYNYGVPLTHTGALVTYADASENFNFAVGMVNGWDSVVDPNDEQALIANLGIEQTGFDLGVTYIKGREVDAAAAPPAEWDRSLVDAVLTIKAASNLTLKLEYVKGTEERPAPVDEVEWSGWGVQMVFQASDQFSVGIRFESLTDEDDVRVGLGPGVGEGTYTNVSIAPMFELSEKSALRFEVRVDGADWDAFIDEDGLPTDKQTTFGVEAICKF